MPLAFVTKSQENWFSQVLTLHHSTEYNCHTSTTLAYSDLQESMVMQKTLSVELSTSCNVIKITLATIMFFAATARSAFPLSLRQFQMP